MSIDEATRVSARSAPRAAVDRGDLLWIGLALVVLLGTSALFAWRLLYAPDEGNHLNLLQWQAHHLTLDSWKDWQYGGRRGHQFELYSPAPYLPYVPFEWLDRWLGPVGDGAGRFIVRSGGLLVAAAQFLVTIAIVRRMARAITVRQATAVAFVANLLPQLRFTHGYVTADGVTILAGTACFATALRILQRERVGLGDAALVGLVLALVAHCRYNVFLVGALLGAVFAYRVIRQASGLRQSFRLLGVAVVIPLLLAGWFHLAIYNELGSGQVLASATEEQFEASTGRGVLPRTIPFDELVTLRENTALPVWAGVWMAIPLSPDRAVTLSSGQALLLLLPVLAGIAGLFVPRGRVFSSAGRVVGLGAVTATIAIMVVMELQYPFAPVGRFLLPAAVTALVAVILGTAALVRPLTGTRRGVWIATGAWGVLLGTMLVSGLARLW